MKRPKIINNKKGKTIEGSRPKAAWYFAILVVISAVLGYYFSAHAYLDPFHTNYAQINYTIQNWGMAFIVLEALFAYVLKRLQGGVYWYAWLQLQQPSPDERQLAVRKLVYERAYAFAVFFILIIVPAAAIAIAHYAEPARGDLFSRSSWISTIFFVSLPSLLAAWRKDS